MQSSEMTLKKTDTMQHPFESNLNTFEIFAIFVLVIMAMTAAFLAFTVLL